MTGEYKHTLDAKGRLFIPSRLREELSEEFYITLSMDKCLSVYSGKMWNSFMERVSEMPFAKQRKMRPLFAFAVKCEPDAQGRVLLPANLREFAGLTKNVTVVGCGSHAEIWDGVLWEELCREEITPENIAAVMEELEI